MVAAESSFYLLAHMLDKIQGVEEPCSGGISPPPGEKNAQSLLLISTLDS